MKLLNYLYSIFTAILIICSIAAFVATTALLLVLYDVIDIDIYREPVAEQRIVVEPVRVVMDETLEWPGIEEPVEMVRYFDVPLDDALQGHIFALCDEKGLDATIVLAIIEKESRYRDYVVGDGGRSFGLMQIQERWHRQRMEELGCDDLLDPYQNVEIGIDYLAELAGRGRGIEWTLMAYNGGPSYANRKSREGIVSDYAREILGKSVGFEKKQSG